MKKSVSVSYVDTEKTFEIEERNLLDDVFPRIPCGIPEEQQIQVAVDALDNPTGSEPLSQIVGPDATVALLSDDWTRPTPVYRIMPVVIDRLLSHGVKKGNIRIIVARGTHAALSREQMIQKLGSEIVERFPVENHNPDENLTHLGESKRGTPVYINSSFMEPDVKIAVGWLVAHPVAGYGGGAKIIVPGVASRMTIHHNHAQAEEEGVAIGIADGNPVREDMEDIARMAGLDFIVNVMLNAKHEILDAVAGDVVAAHREGIKRSKRFFGVKVDELADIVVIAASPRDATFGHSSFVLPCGAAFAKPDGTIIWVAPCLTGPGSPEGRAHFKESLCRTPDELMAAMKRGEVAASGGVFQWVNLKVLHRNKVVLVSDSISRQESGEFGLPYGDSIQEALDQELAQNPDATVRIIPMGGLAVPIYG
jgi:nickel-dependent lactate racemase